MALGEILKNAREQKGYSPSVVAEATHMKVQMVEDLEREDFRRIAAPIYGRGFVKLYADFLNLDAEPLIRDFMELFSGPRPPALRQRETLETAPAAVAPEEAAAPAAPPEPSAAPSVVTRPQRQPVEARPLVRPLSATRLPEVEPGDDAWSEDPDDEAPAVKAAPQRQGAAPERPPLVVASEDDLDEGLDEPDLFHPHRPSRPRPEPAPLAAPTPKKRARGKAGDGAEPPIPIFKIGGRMNEARLPGAQDPERQDRQGARLENFMMGVNKLRAGMGGRLSETFFDRRRLALFGAGLAMLSFLAVGVTLLFRMTGGEVRETPGGGIEMVAPPPDLYVD